MQQCSQKKRFYIKSNPSNDSNIEVSSDFPEKSKYYLLQRIPQSTSKTNTQICQISIQSPRLIKDVFYVLDFLDPFLTIVLFLYFEREREGVCVSRGGQRERRKGIPSWLCAVSTKPGVGLDPLNHEIMTLAEIRSQTLNQLSHPRARAMFNRINKMFYQL